jgi:class 3 adenylate cyclase/predicted ATPase
MDFTALRTQVMALLQGEGRVAYRALKLQFRLDDDTLEALKDDLIYAKRLAVDEEGRVLVWTGETSSAPPTASPVPLPATPDVYLVQGEAAPVAPPTPEAERRQLTVMFCDLVDSTRLSSHLDPEEYRDVVRAYQNVCTEVIQRYEGHVAQLLGDGLLVYFGYPYAHEDDAHRAIRTGLGILAAMGDLNSRLQQDKGIQLAIRVGIHTGLVVVGEMGGQGRQEQLALGQVPNVCSRIEGLAAPNTTAMSEATYRLVQGYFDCQDLGAQTFRGVAEPVHVYRVLQESGARGRLDVAVTRGLTPLIGRESEVTLLQERWEQAKAGHGHVVLLTGDAGIGKSRLVQVLKDHIANEPQVHGECRSSPYYQNTALYPLPDLFQRILQWQPDETPDEKLAKLEQALSQYRLPFEESVLLFASLLSLPVPKDRYPPLALSPQRQRQKLLEAIVAILLELAERQSVLLIIEDLHWSDPSTLELLNLLIDQTPTAPLLVLLTCRPHFQPAWHHRSYITEMTVNRLSPVQVEQIVNRMTDGKTLPTEVLQQIIAKTDGVPLFVEEMTKAILESGSLKAVDGHYELTGVFSTLAIPVTLQDSLMARLDRLVTAKAVAQTAAVIGRQFAYDLLLTVSQLDASTLQRELERLVEAEIVYQRGLPPQASYLFKHALIQDAAYQSLLKSTRQQYHQRIARELEAKFPETAETQPELVAHHYTEASLTEQAVLYWHKAGQSAIQRSAHVEAISHLTKGLELLQTLTHTSERARTELAFQTALGQAFIAVRGYASEEVEYVYQRARALSQEVDDPAERVRALMGLYVCFFVRAHHEAVHALTGELLQLGQALQDPLVLIQTYTHEGESRGHQGKLALARTHLEHAMSLYRQQRYAPSAYFFGHHPVVQNLGTLAWVLWVLGYPERAVQRCDEALTFAQGLSHPFSLAFAIAEKVHLHQLRRETHIVQEQAETLLTVSTEHGFPLRAAIGSMFLGWARVERGAGEEEIARIEEGIAAFQATGARLLIPWLLGLRAEAYGKLGQVKEGLSVVGEALRAVDDTGEHFYEAELYRLKGELLLQQSLDNQAEAESCFNHAIHIAQSQQAKSWELRAATSLARLWQQQGKRAEAHALLAPVYHWFTEGFDTADLQDAQALLAALGEQRHDV